MDIIKSRTDVM